VPRHRVRHVGVRTVLPARCPGCKEVIGEKGELRAFVYVADPRTVRENVWFEHKARGCVFRPAELRQAYVQEVLLV
jgi:hypothetical protein